MRTIEHNGIKWVDALRPNDADIKFLESNFQFHHLLLEEIKTPTYHPLLESYPDYLFVILHFPHFYRESSRIQAVEVDFLITRDCLITVRYQNFPDFEDAFREIEANPGSYSGKTTGHLFHHIVKKLFSRTFPELDKIKESIDDIEESIFESFNEDIIERISLIRREILDFIRALKPQKSVWDAVPLVAKEFWGDRMKPYVADLVADYGRTLHFVETHREVVESLHFTSSSILDNKRNYVIKVLTVFTAIILPLSLVASVYGMNLTHLPIADDPRAFWWFFWGMILTTVVAVAWLKKKKWL